MGIFMERCMIMLVNVFLPPLSVMLVAGVGMDALINSLWFLCGVIPGHIHGFYVTWTYFSRKRKVRKGRYPGGPKPFIYSSRVINGDASDERVRQLRRAEQAAKDEELMMPKRSSRRRRSPLGGGGGGSTLGHGGSRGSTALGSQQSTGLGSNRGTRASTMSNRGWRDWTVSV